jgi:molybdate transport system ATP-binding protein
MSGLDVDLALPLDGHALAARITLERRGVTTLSGPSGAGKTTLLRCIAGLVRPHAGHVRWGAETWFDASRGIDVPVHLRGIGYVSQQAHLFPHLDVRGNLDYGARRAGERPGVADEPALLEALGITPLLGRRVRHLSGGERQRVAIGRALLGRPRLLLLDEPVSALDEHSTADVHDALERVLAMLSLPALYVSHDLREAARLADRMLWMERGRIIAEGPATRVLSDPSMPFAQADDAASVLDGRIDAIDVPMGLARVALDGAHLWIAATANAAVGARVRVIVQARDVSVALDRPGRLSVLNVLEGTVTAIGDAPRAPAFALVRVEAGGCRLLARVTRRSVAELDLSPGRVVHALVKSAALAR